MPLIVIDGPDGSGKATHTELLLKRLEKGGHQTFTVSFPTYGTESCKAVEAYLNGDFGSAEDTGPYFTSMLYAFNRYKEAGAIRNALSEGKVVVLNRYVSSNMGHQAGKIRDELERKKFLQWNWELEFEIFQLPEPDLVVVVDMPPIVGQQFVGKKGDRAYLKGKKMDIHEEDVAHLEQASQAYLDAADKYGWSVISCTKSTVTEEVLHDSSISPEKKVRTLQEINDDIYTLVKPLLK